MFRLRAPTAHLNHRGRHIQSFLPKKESREISERFWRLTAAPKSAHMALREKEHSWKQVYKLLLLLMHTHALLSAQGGAAQSGKA